MDAPLLPDLQYARKRRRFQCARGFGVRGDVAELHPADEEFAYRIEFFGYEVDRIDDLTRSTSKALSSPEYLHYLEYTTSCRRCVRRVDYSGGIGTASYAAPPAGAAGGPAIARTHQYYWEMIQEAGYWQRHRERLIDGSMPPGTRPFTLIDYFPSISCSWTNCMWPYRRCQTYAVDLNRRRDARRMASAGL